MNWNDMNSSNHAVEFLIHCCRTTRKQYSSKNMHKSGNYIDFGTSDNIIIPPCFLPSKRNPISNGGTARNEKAKTSEKDIHNKDSLDSDDSNVSNPNNDTHQDSSQDTSN
ncbi:hypothetical protein BDA99DRAFT_540702 [Phascolomyces articulosus]|uniref:Uncharacterized protein n=1 Tax=Phascolomyces articulosus TaxID=60185 RepID=A0AAD5K6R7_9FUNG|nr:hypothetical protein BDA99DRAFT_540702 [Phascolomyces articulosus]